MTATKIEDTKTKQIRYARTRSEFMAIVGCNYCTATRAMSRAENGEIVKVKKFIVRDIIVDESSIKENGDVRH